MSWNDQDWKKFLLADDDDDRFYVIHLHHPRFVGEVFPNDEDGDTGSVEPTFIDDIKHIPASFIAQLTQEAEDFFQEEMKKLDEDEE